MRRWVSYKSLQNRLHEQLPHRQRPGVRWRRARPNSKVEHSSLDSRSFWSSDLSALSDICSHPVNPNDGTRDAILRRLYQVHEAAKSPRSAAVKVSELHRAL